MIKPDAVGAGHIGSIIHMITEAGFLIIGMKLTRLSIPKATQFYEVHKDRPFFDDLIRFMSSGPIVALYLEKENAIEEYRKLIGSTNPEDADEGTIRKRFAADVEKNAVHGSDSDENALLEGRFFFSDLEIF